MLLSSLKSGDLFTLVARPALGVLRLVKQTGGCFVPIESLDPRIKLSDSRDPVSDHYAIWSGRPVELVSPEPNLNPNVNAHTQDTKN